MKCDQIQDRLIDFIENQLPDQKQQEVETHLASCRECRRAEKETRALLNEMSQVPQKQAPTHVAKAFESLLAQEKQIAREQQLKTKNAKNQTISVKRLIPLPLMRAAAAILLVGLSIFAGMKIQQWRSPRANAEEIIALQNQMQDVKYMIMTSMLEKKSPSERIKAVNYLEKKFDKPDPKLIDALFQTLNTDPNVNVRLAAAYSLKKFATYAPVRQRLVAALSTQTKPMIQIVLINMMVEFEEKKAVQPMQEILENENTMDEVKHHAQIGIKVLI